MSGRRFKRLVKRFNTVLNALQWVENRLGTKKKSDGEALQLDNAKFLRQSLEVLTGIYDIMHFNVHPYTLHLDEVLSYHSGGDLA